ncbi:hypothetical protein ACHMWN_03055 [Pedobacter sp. UC225_61]|uniref:hypothetical protein n=1 Tax=Pedobacter sp. UC225_61 TaxID=3374623 RepID=UPI0037B6B905
MLNIKILAVLIILTISKANCQNRVYDEKGEIHKRVVSALKKEGEKFAIYPSTKKSSFSNFDFSGGGRGLDTISNRVSNKKEWINFIKSIDTASITDYQLDINNTSSKEIKQLIFAPILFSKKNDKALCITKIYSISSQTGQVSAWYFEKEKSIWILKDVQIFLLIN